MSTFRIDGVSESISVVDLMNILTASPLFESCNISIVSIPASPGYATNASPAKASPEPIPFGVDIDKLNELIVMKDLSLQQADINMAKAAETIKAFHSQQQALFEEFRVLRQKYDEQKVVLMNILWEHCCKHHPGIHLLFYGYT